MLKDVHIKATDKHVVRSRGLLLLQPGHREVRKLKAALHEPSIHGHRIWNSSFLVMDYLGRQKLPRGSRLMDVGCGWGPLAVYAAKRLGARVTAVDADPEVFPYLDLHARINKVQVETRQRRFERLTKKDFEGVHTIVGADICFWDELAPVLFKMIRRAFKAGVKKVVIADPGRPPFYALADLCEAQWPTQVVERKTSTPKKLQADLLIVTPA